MGESSAMTTARPPKSALKKRNSQGSSGNLTSPADGRRSGAGGSTAQMMRMYTDDAPGLKVDPITVLVFSLMFIGAVFVLHIWGKFTRG